MNSLINKIVYSTSLKLPISVINKFTSPYVAGNSIYDGINYVKNLNSKGYSGTLDLLGEEINDNEYVYGTNILSTTENKEYMSIND